MASVSWVKSMAEITEAIRAHGLHCGHGEIPSPFRFEPDVTLGYQVVLQANVEIAGHTYINGGVVHPNVRIGRFCSIAYQVTLGVGNHPTHLLSTHPFATKSSYDREHTTPFKTVGDWRRPTVIGHDVWIGQNAVVVQGVTIGTGAIIGACALVTKDVPPYAIVGGVPAKVIRYRFDDATIEALLASEWWTLPFNAIREFPTNNIAECLARIAASDVPREPPNFLEI